MKLVGMLQKDIKTIQKHLNGAQDLLVHEFFMQNGQKAALLFFDGMSDKRTLSECIIQPMTQVALPNRIDLDYLIAHITSSSEIKVQTDSSISINFLLCGDAVLLLDHDSRSITIGAKGYTVRSISEPPTSATVKGPREGFTEDFKQNAIMMRRRLHSKDFMLDYMQIGKYTKTNIFICYIRGIASEQVLKQIKKQLEKISIDGIVDSSYLTAYLDERPLSIFKQVGSTEKPDILTAKLLEGRVGIIVDGSPMVLTLPYLLLEDFQSAEDYYERTHRASFTRLLRFTAALISILLPACYVAAQLFHLQLFSLRFLSKVMGSVSQITLSPALEMFSVLLIFELLRESSIRMPKYVGMALSVVGALVLGDTAVRAGIVTAPSVMVMALSTVCLYTVPDQEGTLSLLRMLFLGLAGAIGMFGILIGVTFLAIYLVSLQNFGTPYLAPFAPLVPSDMKDSVVRTGLLQRNHRPNSIPHNNHKRQNNLAQGE